MLAGSGLWPCPASGPFPASLGLAPSLGLGEAEGSLAFSLHRLQASKALRLSSFEATGVCAEAACYSMYSTVSNSIDFFYCAFLSDACTKIPTPWSRRPMCDERAETDVKCEWS